MKTEVVTASTAYAVDLEEAKNYLRIEPGETAHDDVLASLIPVAQGYVESHTGRRLQAQTVNYYIDNWPGGDHIKLPYAPLTTSVAPTVTYVDTDSSSITFESTNWVADAVCEPGRIVLEYSRSWPSGTLHPRNPIRVQYRCGYDGSSAVPEMLKLGVKLVVAQYNEFREPLITGTIITKVPKAVENLIAPYKIFDFNLSSG
jgi:uncharacterized phiE125 gp8 family phage protein